MLLYMAGKDFADAIKVLRKDGYSGLSRWALNVITCIFIIGIFHPDTGGQVNETIEAEI